MSLSHPYFLLDIQYFCIIVLINLFSLFEQDPLIKSPPFPIIQNFFLFQDLTLVAGAWIPLEKIMTATSIIIQHA